MDYIVFDLEWNIAGKANKVEKATQEAIPFEIIEIGAVKLNSDFQYVSKFSVFIRPQVYPILSSHVAAVTRRLQQSLKYGLRFTEAANGFMDWCGHDYLFCTWSESDTAVLKTNLKYFGLADHLPVHCLDVQYVFDALIEQSNTQRSIEYALDFLRLPTSQPFHQAVSDAYYTGMILQKIAGIMIRENSNTGFIGRYAFDPNLTRSSQLTLNDFASIETALAFLHHNPLACPACGLILQPQQPWLREDNKASAVFACQVHGRILGKTRFLTKGPKLMQTKVAIRIDRDQEN